MQGNGKLDVARMIEGADLLPPAKPNGGGVAAAFTPEQWKVIQRLKDMSPIERDRAFKPAAEELGCGVGTLKTIVRGQLRKEAEMGEAKGGAGRTLAVPLVEPWPGTVDGAALLDEIADLVRTYLVTREGVPEAVALWVLHTHALEAAHISPRLAITSPVPRCGKTRLLTLLSVLAARPIATTSITASAIFRTIEMIHPTLLVDEADSFLAGNEELRGVINAGHCRAASTVLRTIELPEGYEVRGFDVFGALAIAAIGKLAATIDDRSINVPMRRRRLDEEISELRLDRLDEFVPVARRCVRWALDHLARLRGADPSVPALLHDRARDNWRPLLAIADLAGGDWAQRARDAACLLSVTETESQREWLLADLKTLFDPAVDEKGKMTRDKRDVLFTSEILAALGQMEHRPWPEFRKEKPITAPQLSALLRPLGVLSNTVRRGDDTAKGYRREDLEDAFARYLPPPASSSSSSSFSHPNPKIGVTPSHAAETLGFGPKL
jgi:putative DNA primase/helicase